MSPINEAIAAAEEFIRWGRFHQDQPRPDVLIKKIEVAVDKLEALLDEVK